MKNVVVITMKNVA